MDETGWVTLAQRELDGWEGDGRVLQPGMRVLVEDGTGRRLINQTPMFDLDSAVSEKRKKALRIEI